MVESQSSVNYANDARLSAVLALTHTLDKQQPLDTAWPNDRYFNKMSPSDKGFAQLLTKTALRRLGQIDHLLAQFIEQPLNNNASKVKHILRIGVVQLIWLDTPHHAAVHTAVELSKQLKLKKYSGLINAVLKRIIREGPAIIEAQDISVNVPKWLWDSWVTAYGEDTTKRIAHMHLEDPPIDITVKSEPQEWARKLSGVLLPLGSVRLRETGNITLLEGFDDGGWWVQDIAASIPARLLGNVKDKKVIDLCAAPGGKTAQLAVSGAEVSAVDRSKQRLAMLKTNVSRLKLQADYVVSDVAEWLPSFAPDAILLDAPCSATGTLRRHPDVVWHRGPADIERLVRSQHKLLRHAADMLAPGGTMVYSVCSLQPEEGENQITEFLKDRPEFEVKPVTADQFGGLEECITPRGAIRTLPCHIEELGGMDGFYAVILTKRV